MAGPDDLARTALEEEREQLRHQLADLGAETTYDENFADSGQVAAEQGEHRALIGQLEETLVAVEQALVKLDAGTYGVCESCAKTIAEPRLEAMPATRFCIDCAN